MTEHGDGPGLPNGAGGGEGPRLPDATGRDDVPEHPAEGSSPAELEGARESSGAEKTARTEPPTPGSAGPEHLPEHEGHGPVRPPQPLGAAAAAVASGNALAAVDFGPVPSEPPPAPPERPLPRESEHPSVQAMAARFGDQVLGHHVSAGNQHVVWIDPDRNLEILGWLKDDPDHRYDMMSDVTGVDYGGGRPVEVVYQMFSTTYRRALRVRCRLPLDALEIDSVEPLWKSANWLEREVYDLFGVTFRGHPDLRRILMPYDYEEGYPLRKDFPLRGRFSRAEQTRRALNQRVERFYRPEELAEEGHEPQQVVAVRSGRRHRRAEDGDEATSVHGATTSAARPGEPTGQGGNP